MKKNKISPFLLILLGFLTVIIVGTIILKLPFSTTQDNLSWVDALFTATSAVCVTGLSTVEIASTFTTFGKIVIAILIQIGGLGIVTVGVFVIILIGGKISFGNRILIKESLNQNTTKGMVALIKHVVIIAFIFEFFAMIIFLIFFLKEYSFFKALGISAFHAISSFNNAGFDILGSQSLVSFQNNFLFLLTTSLCIIIGGIGFIVIFDIYNKKNYKKLNIHSKIVIKTTIWLIVIGTLLLKITSNISLLLAYFQSVSARTAGFYTINLSEFSNASILVLMVLMFIGASPVSTGGGIKTTTFYIMMKVLYSYTVGQPCTTHYRKISNRSILKAFALSILAILVILLVLFILFTLEQGHSFKAIIFEVFSAFGTVGLSLGITPLLKSASKITLSILMLVGRLGPLTIISIFNKNYFFDGQTSISYPEEKFIIG